MHAHIMKRLRILIDEELLDLFINWTALLGKTEAPRPALTIFMVIFFPI